MDELRARLRTQFLDLFDTLPPDIAARSADSVAKAALSEIGETHVIVSLEDAEIVSAVRALFDEPGGWDEIWVNREAMMKLMSILGRE
jgi:hypothetical protein